MSENKLFIFIAVVISAFFVMCTMLQIKSTTNPLVSVSGTAWFINSNGYLATAYHVVENTSNLTITYQGKVHKTSVVAIDPKHDVAILKSDLKNTRAIPSSTQEVFNSSAMMLGFPLPGIYPPVLHFSIGKATTGGFFSTYIYTSICGCPGNSGGPIILANGSAISVHTNSFDAFDYNSYHCSKEGFGSSVNYVIQLAYYNKIEIVISDSPVKKSFKHLKAQYYNSVVLVEGIKEVN